MTQAKIRNAIEVWRATPETYHTNILGVELETYQSRVTQAIADNQRIAIKSCHDMGKSFIVARTVPWFMHSYPYSKVVTTAPTFLQVKNILWSELRSAHGRAKVPLGGDLNLTEWKLAPDWFAIGFTPRNEVTGGIGQGTSSSFQGFHAEGGILILFDEATGIPANIWTMAEGLMTQHNVKFVCIGNPTSRNSDFFKCFSSPEWTKLTLTCFDSPNLIANGIVDRASLEKEVDLLRSMSDDDVQARLKSYVVKKPYLLSTAWVMGRALTWGLTHPLFISKVLGEFPEEGDDTLIPLGVVEEAQRRAVFPSSTDRKIIGVDVARFGSDSTVLTAIHGEKFLGKKVLIKRNTMEVSGAVIAFAQEIGKPDVIVIDETGLGAGVVDALVEYTKPIHSFLRGTEIRGVQFGAGFDKSRSKGEEDAQKYTNLKAKMFDLLAQDLRRGLALPDEDVYLDELPTILYAYDSKGRMAIESKDDYKKRTGRGSPDHADSLALANYGRYAESRAGSLARLFGDEPGTYAGGLSAGDNW